MKAKNMVIAGDYDKKLVMVLRRSTEKLVIVLKTFGKDRLLAIDKNTVDSYEVVTEDSTKSASSAIARGALGGFLLGPVGLLAGVSAKNKNSHTIALQFKDGKKSLIEIDGKLYKLFVREMF